MSRQGGKYVTAPLSQLQMVFLPVSHQISFIGYVSIVDYHKQHSGVACRTDHVRMSDLVG